MDVGMNPVDQSAVSVLVKKVIVIMDIDMLVVLVELMSIELELLMSILAVLFWIFRKWENE
jgi:hypothetical protein